MSITGILRPLPGERVVALAPEDASTAAVTWLRRPNLFAGRALTAPTLDARSAWAAGRIAQRGQAFTPGVVRGLEVGYARGEPPEGDERAELRVHIAAGLGLSCSGEDVVLARPIEVDFWSLPVVAPPAVFEGGGFGGGGVLQPRAIGPSLRELLDERPGALPLAGVLVFQPATTERAEIDPEDPCDRGCGDQNVGFEDWRLSDAARLLWYAWPEDWRPLPSAGPRFRNQLAHLIFDAERGLAAHEVLPWEEIGVPVALFGVDAEFLPAFADRAAVVRQGGRARYSRLQLASGAAGLTLATSARLPALWQAQIEQLAEQIAELGDPAPGPAELALGFDRLPPCGLLPRNVADLAARRSAFFPGGFDLDAVPVPMEQLDLALRECAGMAPLDFARGERVRVLVPVSQSSWEPRLLLDEVIDPEFQVTLDRFLIDRARALAGRQGVRLKVAVLLRALRGESPPVPAIEDDPQAVEPETLAGWGPPPASGGHRSALRAGEHAHGFNGGTPTLVTVAGDLLYSWVYLDADNPPSEVMIEWRAGTMRRRSYWGTDLIERGTAGEPTRTRVGDLPSAGRWVRLEVSAEALGLIDRDIGGIEFVLFDGRAAFASTGRVTRGAETMWFDGFLPTGATATGDEDFELLTGAELLAPFEGRSGVVPGTPRADFPDGASASLVELIADARLTDLLSAAEEAQLPARGVEGFIAYLKARADRADDLVDYGFLKVQTDIYRVRQLVLGTTEATRLAVSPTLANIAQAETAIASQQSISTFFDKLRTTPAPPAAPPPPPASGGGAGGMFMFNMASLNLPLSGVSLGLRRDTIRLPSAEIALGLETSAPILAATTYTPVDVTSVAPLTGSFDVRTLSIADRLRAPKAQEARDYTTSTRHEAVLGLVRLADELRAQDGEMPGLFQGIDVWGLADDEFVPGGDDPVAAIRRPLLDFISGASRNQLLAQLLVAPTRQNADESAFFSDSADMADRTVALMRQVEGRVKRYRTVIAACELAAGVIRSDLKVLGRRELTWSEVLGEARHDVAVTRALIAEEEARLAAINERRAEVLDREVRFLAFIRPRAADNLAPSVSRVLDPGLLEAPAPACLQEHADVPEELRDMLRVLREAPADWFRLQTRLLDALDRVDLLVKAVRTAQLRTQIAQAQPPAALLAPAASGLLAAIGAVQLRQRQQVGMVRAQSLALDVSRITTLTWQGARAEAAKVVSLGDLIDGEHGSGLVARNAAAFFERVGHICGCLHAGFSGVLPAIRLDWAEILSQFDTAANLRNLAALPRWPEIEYVDRRRLQGLVDWLFDQIDPSEARAADLMNDVVRMTMLLASHAPVGRIIAGRLPRPVTARPGIRIPLVALDPARLRVGMHALVYRAETIVARAVVEDVGQGEASARVTYTAQASVELDTTVRVQFAQAASTSFAAAGFTLGGR